MSKPLFRMTQEFYRVLDAIEKYFPGLRINKGKITKPQLLSDGHMLTFSNKNDKII
jgi:hypothetical protein